MRQIIYRHLSFFFTLIGLFAGQLHAQMKAVEEDQPLTQLRTLLKQRNYFALEKQLRLVKTKLEPHVGLYFQSFLDNAFNQNKKAVAHINSLLHDYALILSDSVKATLFLLRADSYFKLFDYAAAARDDSVVLERYATILDRHKIEEIKNKFIIDSGLMGLSPQQTTIAKTTIIPWNKNKLGIIEIPVISQRTSYNAVFDTRANISTITVTYATKLHLRLLPVSYYEGSGVTGIRFKTSLAIADSLMLGNILIRQVVFQVVPDSVLYIAPVKFQINIIVGFPIISQLNEVHFYKDGRMEIPLNETRRELRNMALDGLNPVIALRTISDDTLNFAFDFGASETMLFAAYFERYRKNVLAEAEKRSTEYGGAGGIQKKEVLTLPSVVLFLGDKRVMLKKVDVLSEKVYPDEKFYGNIGQDFVSQFREVVLNFKSMYIKGL